MCGIAGSIGPAGPDRAAVDTTLALMGRRGPDACGTIEQPLADLTVRLLHTRLSIIDLDPRSNQPFEADDCVITFNGEIYNFVELRRELAEAGEHFATTSDTEVLVKAYRRWGTACFDRLEGMWAFALVDRREGALVLARDRFGEKPLYLFRAGDTLYFGSEIKFLAALSGHRPAVDLTQVRRFLAGGYRALFRHAASFFGDVTELPAGTFVKLTGPQVPPPTRYWALSFRPRAMTRADAVAGVRERLLQAVALRLRADVPVAFCLSGGVDSGVLVSLAVRQLGCEAHTFSIVDRDPRYDERTNIAATVGALGCRNTQITLDHSGFLGRLEELVGAHDAPVITISYVVHAMLSQAIHRAGYKIALSGTGADELFTGYYDHYGFWLAAMAERDDYPKLLEDWRAGYGRFVRNPTLRNPETFRRNPDDRSHLTLSRALAEPMLVEPLAEDFAETPYTGDVLRNRMLNELFFEVVPVILHEDDRNSMWYSVENRSPYLDRALAEFVFSIPTELLVADGSLKWLLREAAAGVLPDSVRRDRQKRGFNASIDTLLDRADPDVRDRLLSPGPIFDVVRRSAFETFLDGDMTDNERSKFLFSFVSARLFLDGQTAG